MCTLIIKNISWVLNRTLCICISAALDGQNQSQSSNFKISKHQLSLGGMCFQEDLLKDASFHGISVLTVFGEFSTVQY